MASEFSLTSTQSLGGAPPVVPAFASDFGSDGYARISTAATRSLAPQGDVIKYEVEESTDGTNYNAIRQVDGNTTSVSFENVANGTRSYRVRSIRRDASASS